MRMLGFVGILLLLALNFFCLIIAMQDNDWRGIAAMVAMTAMLAFFARVLWLGRSIEKSGRPSVLAPGWAGESVSSFFSYQVIKSPEGLILLIGSAISLTLAIMLLVAPATMGLPIVRVSKATTLFAMWPILAFVLYVRICGPTFETSVFTIIAMLAVVSAPAFIVYFDALPFYGGMTAS